MKLYHRTRAAAADAIVRDGFRDGEGRYMTDRVWRGVWLSDRPIDPEKPDDALLRLEIPASVVKPFQWVDEQRNYYREFLVPAAIVNGYPRPRAVKE